MAIFRRTLRYTRYLLTSLATVGFFRPIPTN
jgi:hypothetical protein